MHKWFADGSLMVLRSCNGLLRVGLQVQCVYVFERGRRSRKRNLEAALVATTRGGGGRHGPLSASASTVLALISRASPAIRLFEMVREITDANGQWREASSFHFRPCALTFHRDRPDPDNVDLPPSHLHTAACESDPSISQITFTSYSRHSTIAVA